MGYLVIEMGKYSRVCVCIRDDDKPHMHTHTRLHICLYVYAFLHNIYTLIALILVI